MKIDWALLAKAAIASPGAPPSILGAGMTSISVIARESLAANVALPADAACAAVPFAIVMGLLASRAETGRQSVIEVTITELDGHERFKMTAQIGIPVAPPDLPLGVDIPINVVLELVFYPAKVDTHSVNVFIDHASVKQMPLVIRTITIPNMLPPP